MITYTFISCPLINRPFLYKIEKKTRKSENAFVKNIWKGEKMLIIVIKSAVYIKFIKIKAAISNPSLTSNSLQKVMKLSTLLMLVVIINVIIQIDNSINP